jgi:hypothetical protein
MFPHYKKFPWFFLKDGWKDLGEIEGIYKSKGVSVYETHSFCRSNAHVGIEDGVYFKFCPRCMVKLTPNSFET